jgi:hypothetical protein
MRPLDETRSVGDTALPVDGIEVEEVSDESTIRQFVADWRRRVSQEYAMALLRDEPGNHARPHVH